jgi:cation:H+ antiporter
MLFSIFLLIIGLIFLIKGADLLVDGASTIAKKFRVSDLMIGLTIVALGTSMPELIVSLLSAVRGSADIGVGNILGSNIANILLILGISSMIYPLRVSSNTIWREIPLAFTATIAVFLLGFDHLFSDTTSVINRADGLMLLIFFGIFLVYTFGLPRDAANTDPEQDKNTQRSMLLSLGFIALGLTGLTIGGSWVVESAKDIARSFGMTERLIGLTIIAVGTSLPELATSGIAAYRKKADIAVGNIVGSNIFNVFWVLGLTATVTDIPVSADSLPDVYLGIIATILLFIAIFIGKKGLIQRWQGMFFLLLYVAYTATMIVRG